jgi:hypothetical protein
MKFHFKDKEYDYWETENPDRRVEIPISLKFYNEFKDKRILEIGNVLVNHIPIKHDVVDKYDTSEHCIQKDIINYSSDKKYDLIISISTLEHIGYEPPEKVDEQKIVYVIEHIKNNLLEEGGKFVFTIPLGFNKNLDEKLMKRKIKLDEQYFMKRVTFYRWVQDFDSDMTAGYYDNPFGCANKILIGVIK